MGKWGILRRRSAAKPARTFQRKPQDSLSSRCYRGLRIEQFEERALLSIGTWSGVGPAPIYDGDTVTVAPVSPEGDYLNEVAGAITAVLAHPTNADILYVGTANGGVWRTDNATAASPTWTALTDNMESLSIGSLAFDTTDTSYQTIVAGIAKMSDASRAGGALSGLLFTSDGGDTWTQLDGQGVLDGKNCTSVAVRGNTILVAVDNAKSGSYSDVGIYRSTNGGTSFTKISSGSGGTAGLPGGIAYDLAADPTNSKVFYTAVVGADTFEGANGIYKTADSGAHWTKVSSLALDAFLATETTTTTSGTTTTTVGATHRVQITVGNSGQVYVGIVNAAISTFGLELDYDQLAAVYRSGDSGTTWTAMDLPKAVENGVSQAITFNYDAAADYDLAVLPSGQGTVHFSIVADPTNANIVYIGGDAQMTTTSTSSSSTALLFRGDASKAIGKQWASLTGASTASGSTPHAESRDMAFDADGRLIEVDDGGVYYRSNPTTSTGDWYSLNGDLQVTEITSIAYDTISNVIIAGTQDNGVAEQTDSGSSVWREVTVGDGGDVAVVVDDVSLADTGESYRYSSGAYLEDFVRRTIDADNNVVETVKPALIVLGTGKMTFSQLDGGQYKTPIAINAVDPSRLVIGGAYSVYESTDRGATLTDLYEGGGANAVVYGGYIGATSYVNVLWVATDDGVYLRTTAGGALTKTSYSGGAALDIVVNPTNWKNAYVIDDSHIYATTNGGSSWIDITGVYAASGLRAIEYISSGSTGAVLVGGDQGVYRCQADALGTWYTLGADLPNAAVYDMDYDAEDDVLVVGTLGRGAWTLDDVRTEIFGTPRLLSVGLDATVYTSKVSPTLTTTPSEVILTFNDGQTIDTSTLSGIQVTTAGENGKFYDPETNPYDTDDVVVPIGYVGIGDNPNEVVLRFSSTLADGSYHITLVGQGSDGEHLYYGPDGKVVSPLTNSAGVPIGFGDLTDPDTGEIYQDGVNYVWSFTLTLAPEVTAVVPQPITRAANGTLSQARNQIEVYFSQDMAAASAETLAFYQLISTQDTANTADDVVFHPTSAVYNSATRMVTLTFAKDQSGNACTDLASLVTSESSSAIGAFRLRVGNEYRPIVTTERSNPLENDGTDVASTFDDAWDLGSFTYTANTKTGQSWVISGEVAAVVDYELQWPGGRDDVGARSLPEGATDVDAESHTGVDSGDVGNEYGKAEIPTYYYNFKSDYGVVDGSTLKNEVTKTQKQRVREIFSLFTQYFGVQFIETAEEGITFAVGDLRALDPSLTNDSGAAGMAGGELAMVNSYYNWGNCVYGSSFMSTAMHEIAHCLGFMHSYDVAVSEIMGDTGSASTTSSESTFPGNVDINTGLYLYRADSMDVDVYKFTVDQTGTFSAEAIAQQLENASLLDASIILYDANGNVIAGNDDYYDDDSYLTVDLKAGTYYVGICASGTTYDANEADSGIGGTTQGKYELRLNFTPKDNNQLDNVRGVALDGDTDGTAGGAYNFWFETQTAANTLIVDKASTSVATDGSLAHPFKTITSAVAAAKAGDIIRVVGNNFANDNGGDGIIAVAGSQLVDGQKFKISDATTTYVFELDSNNKVTTGNIRVAFTTADNAATVAKAIAAAINSISWIPTGLGTTTSARFAGGIYASATVSGDTVYVNGNTVTIDLGATKLKTTLQDNKAYEIGIDPLLSTLADGKKLEVPQGVTLLFDAGAVVKMRNANIDVGSSTVIIDRSEGAVQVLGTPDNNVWFTSYLNERIGTDSFTTTTTAAAGDWGGLVFRNDYDYDEQADDLTRLVLEQEGIFLNYVNNANISYGGGKVMVNGVTSVYDPIHMNEARPTVTYCTITNSADAAMSADPNSLLESQLHDSYGESVYTLDYNRVGPQLHGNTVADNSLNALFLRVTTEAASSTETLDVAARYDDTDLVLAMPENLTISGDAGGALAVTGTTILEAVGNSGIQAFDRSSFTDGEFFLLSDGVTQIRFEFDLSGNGVKNGTTDQPNLDITVPAGTSTEGIATLIAQRINFASTTYGLKITAAAAGSVVNLSGTTVKTDGLTGVTARLGGRLMIDPGAIVKLSGTRVEVGIGAELIAEGTAADPIVFTSILDDTYGAGGTFDTTNNQLAATAAAGNWGGIYFSPTSTGSIDYVRLSYAGGSSAIEGGFGAFAPVEIRQADVRIADSLFENNTSSTSGDRNGRGSLLQSSVIYVLFSQPVIANNTIRDNTAAAVCIDVNALNAENVADWGRATGEAGLFDQYADNYGALVRGNLMTNNSINGMVVRGGALTTEGIWDDTDIVHVVFGTIDIPNLSTYGGLRLQSSSTASLVVKFSGDNATIKAGGSPLEIDDRVGGTLQVIGTAAHAVVLTSLADDSVSAGYDPNYNPLYDTNNDGDSTGSAGNWAGIELDEYSNDRNVAIILESEQSVGTTIEANGTPFTSQYLGQLASKGKSGDETLRLGFEVEGEIDPTRLTDADVYSFVGYAGTEIWVTFDQTTFSLDTFVELIDADGNVVASSDNWRDELRDASLLLGGNLSQSNSDWGFEDYYSINPRDAGMRLVLPGVAGTQRTYYLRVTSKGETSPVSGLNVNGTTAGHYQMQVKLSPTYEHPGSTVRYSTIKYATNGISIYGQPDSSPLTSDVYDTDAPQNTTIVSNDTIGTAQDAGNLLRSDNNSIDITGYISNYKDVDWYEFTVAYGDSIQSIPGVTTDGSVYPVTIDVDYAAGMARADIIVWVFDSAGTLILKGDSSNIIEDNTSVLGGTSYDDLTAGSSGVTDAYIGPIYLMEGQTYHIAVTTVGAWATASTDTTIRWEPVDSVQRIAEDNIGSENASAIAEDPVSTLFEGASPIELNTYASDFFLGDVTFYVLTDTDLYTADPYTGTVETDVTDAGSLPETTGGAFLTYGDLVMRNDGELYDVSRGSGSVLYDQNQTSGLISNVNTGDARLYYSMTSDGLITYGYADGDPESLEVEGDEIGEVGGVHIEAMALTAALQNRSMYLIGNTDTASQGAIYVDNLLYICTESGTAYDTVGGGAEEELLTTNIVPLASLVSGPQVTMVPATDTDSLVAAADDILDGTQVEITDESGDVVIFEFDCGPDIDMGDGVTAIRDGMTFTVNGVTFEFDSGAVMVFKNCVDGSLEGATFTVTDADGPRTFEFDCNGDGVSGANVEIKIAGNTTAGAVAAAAVSAINTNTKLKAALGEVDGSSTEARVSLIGDAADPTYGSGKAGALCGENDGEANLYSGATSAVLVSIPFEETWDNADFQEILTVDPLNYPAVFGEHLVKIVNANATGVLASYADRTAGMGKNDRLTFNGAATFTMGTADPVNVASLDTVWTQRDGTPHNGTTYISAEGLQVPGSGNVIVDFNAADTALQIAEKLAAAITQAGLVNPIFTTTAKASGGAVQLSGIQSAKADPPLKIEGDGPGGKITGMAFLDGRLYCVSENGGFYEIVNYNTPTFSVVKPEKGVDHIELTNPDGAHLRYIGTVETATGDGVEFAGLSLGPQNVEDGMYSDMFFGVSRGGSVYALELNANQTEVTKAPVFVDGATSIETGLTSVSGLAFSTLDYNLWHVTDYRGYDDGHDTNTTYDQTRTPPAYPAPGGTSFYFGIEDPTAITTISNQPDAMNYYYTNHDIYYSYDFCGGAYGSLTTETFDLTEYEANDCPALYFEYFLDKGSAATYDSARVFASTDGATWSLLADLASSNGQWLQSSVSLAGLAGMSDVRLRFDFSTAGDMNVGDLMDDISLTTTGSYLEGLAGKLLVDGDTYSIDGQVFEFDMGMELDLPSAAGDTIADGETFTIQTRDAIGNYVDLQTFEFDSDGTLNDTNAQAIAIAIGDTTTAVAARIADAINKLDLVNIDGLAISAIIHENRVLIDGAEGMTQSAGAVVELAGNGCGVYDATSIPVVITFKMTAEEVAESMTMAYDQAFAEGYTILAPLPADITDGDTFSLTDDNHTALAFEFDSDGTLNDPSAVAIDISTAATREDVADAIAAAITTSGLNVTTTVLEGGYLRISGTAANFAVGTSVVTSVVTMKRDGSLLHVINHVVDDPGVLPFSNALPGDQSINPPVNQFATFQRGQDNAHEGFYIDNIIVGFTERGEMATQASPGESTFAFAPMKPSGVNTEGYYTVEIRKSEEYAMWPVMGSLALTDSIDTNDRCANEYTLTAPSANDIPNLETFTISDGVRSVTFQFVDETLANGNPNYVSIYFSINQTAAEVAASVVEAINTLHDNGLFEVSAYAIETGSFVYLHDAASVISSRTAGKGDVFSSDIGKDKIPSTGDSATVVDKPLGFDGDTSAFGSIGDDAVIGTTYIICDGQYTTGAGDVVNLDGAWGGTWYDAEKSASNDEDDDLCWAATASNVLAWTGWGYIFDMYTADEIFQYFQDYWTDAGSFPTSAWVWWFQGWNPTEGNGASLDVEGGADFFSTLNVIENYIQYEEDTADALPAIDKFLHDGDGVGLGVYSDAGMAHAITAWGFTYDESNPDYYTGVYVTDSDDDKGGDDALAAPDELHWYAVKWSAGEERWYLQDYYGMDDVYIGTVSGLLSRQVGVSATKYNDTGDTNLVEDQGQIILECNTILYSEEYGVVVAASRTSDGVATPGSAGVLAVVNSEKLVPGVVIENNVLAYGGSGGIHLSGNADEAGVSIGAVPTARIVNNTIFGGMTSIESGFDITLNFSESDNISAAQKAVFEEAAKRWEAVIIGDLEDVGDIDDIVIEVSCNSTNPFGIGGVDGVRGGADAGIPYHGFVSINSSSDDATLLNVATHEFGHALGIGITWDAYVNSTDHLFTGPNALAAYNAAFGLTATGVPLDDGGGHWNEEVLGSEVMTPVTLIGGGLDPISQVTGGALMDMGYVVNLEACDDYGISSGSSSSAFGGVGIRIDDNACATILNNVVVNTSIGIRVGNGCGSTVIGTTVYSGNLANVRGASQTFAIVVNSVDTLFVDAANGNFYPAANSPLIDSSLDSLADRESMTTVRDPLGIDESPILTPAGDLFGQLRIDDPKVSTPTGLGENTYKDRGAIDRVDFDGPTASLASPVDNDTAGVDRDSTVGDVLIAMVGDSMYTQFDVQLSDSGSGIDDTTVTPDVLTLYQDSVELTLGQDYFFRYDATNDRITLIPAAGVWTAGSTYTIYLSTDIKDVAGTSIQPNRTDSTIRFGITLAGYDFGDAPVFVDAAHSVSATEFPEGAMHLVVPGAYLGKSITDEVDATVNSTATGDSGDDGVVLEDSKYLVSTGVTETAAVKTISLTASTAGFVNAWIDWNGDGVFDPASEKISFIGNSTGAVVEGENTMTFAVPQGLKNIDDMDVYSTYMRVRFSTTGLLTDGTAMLPTGEASDGEVEDYIVSIIPTPGSISGSVSNDYDYDGTLDAGEPGLGGWTVYIDANGNGRLDYSETSTTTAADGSFTLVDVIPGVYTVREIVKSGWEMTDPFDGYFTVTVTTANDTSGCDFLNRDLTPPSVVSIEVDDGSGTVANPTNAATVYFTVTFSEPVTGVDIGDFELVVSGGITGASITDVTANPDGSYLVSVATGEGGGTLQLNLVDNDSIVDLSGNPLGDAGTGNGDFTGPSVTIDKVVPTAASITLVSSSLTNAASVVFNVTFSEPVTGVDSNDFDIVASGVANAAITSIVLTDGVYVVTVSTGTGDGTLQLNLVNDGSIIDLAGNSLADGLAGPSCTIDKTAPAVVSVKRNDSNPTTASTVAYTVTFSESVTGVDITDFLVAAAGPAGYSITSVSGDGTTYIVSVKTGIGDGTLRLDVNDNNSIGDAAGNKLGGSALHDGDYDDGEAYTIDRTHPTTLSLSNARVAETAALGTVVGVLSSTGPHSGAYTYELVSGTGSDDNASFRVVGDYLVTNAAFDFDVKSSYQIRVRTTDSAGYSLDKTFTIAVIAEADTLSIGDLVWNDANKNGLQGSTESGVIGAVVELFCSPTGVIGGANDYSLGQTVTDANGNYKFDALLTNLNYYLVFRTPSGYTFTTANVGADDTIDSDAGSTGKTALFTLTASSTAAVKSGFDAGLVAATATSYDFASALGSTGVDAGRAVAADADGNVYVVGTFNGTVDFDLGAGVYNLTSAGGADVYIAKYSSTGALLWARAVGGAADDSAAGITLTADGRVAVAGGFQGTADFLSGSGSVTLTSAGSYDVFVMELDAAGTFVWAKGMGGAGDDVANAIAVDASGNVYTTGYFQNTADFNPDAGSNALTAIGPKDVFVSKLNADGGYVWAERMGGTGWSQGTSIGNGIAVAADGSVYVTGSFQGTADFDASAAVNTLTCAGNTDVFLVKLTSAGGFTWVRGIGGSSEDSGAAVAVSPDGNVAITGGFQGVVDFNPGTATYNLDSAGYRRMFVTEFESDGDFAWADAFGGTGWDLATGIDVDAAGNVYVTGGFWGTADFNPGTATYSLASAGQKDAFLVKLDTNGNFAWAQRTAGGTGDDCGYGVAVSTNGAVYTTGYFNGTADFDPTSATYNLTSAGGQDAFLSKYATELTVTINQGAAQTDPTLSTPVVFRVVFSAAVSDFTAADLTLGGTAPGTRVAVVTPVGTDGTTYDVSVTGMTGSGTVTAAIAAGKAHSTAGKANAASTSTDNSVTYSVSKPVVSGIAVADSGSSKNGILEPTDTLTVTWIATAANGIASQTVTVDGTAVGTPAAGGGSAYYCSIGSWALGDHTVVVTTTDSLGISTSANYTFTVVPATVTGPSILGVAIGETGSSNKNGVLEPTDALLITWVAKSNDGIASQTVTVDGNQVGTVKAAGSPYFYCSIGSWAAGSHTYTITTTDSKGVSSSVTNTFVVQPAPTTGPSILGVAIGETGSSNKNGVLEPTDALLITWVAKSTDGIASQTVTVDSNKVGTVKAAGSPYFYCSIGSWAAGSHTYTITTTDSKGVSSSVTNTFVVQTASTTAPVVSGIAVGESGSSNKNGKLEPTDKLTVTWRATSVKGIASQTVTVNGKAVGAAKAVSGTSNFYCSIGAWAAGTYTVKVTTTDKAGVSNSASTTFTVLPVGVGAAPVLSGGTIGESSSSDKDRILESTDKLTLTWSATAANGIASQVVTVGSKVVGSGNLVAGTTNYWCSLGTWPAGTYNVTIKTTDKAGLSTSVTKSFTVVSALTVDASTAADGSADVVTDAQVAAVADAAAARLKSELGSQVASTLAGVAVKVANLPAGILGEAAGNTIWIDDDAAGYGWFVDATPGDDAEYTWTSSTKASAVTSAAANRADLLTAVMHEMGHVLGYDHSASTDLMSATLPLGERRVLADGKSEMMALAAADSLYNSRPTSTSAIDDLFASFNDDDEETWM